MEKNKEQPNKTESADSLEGPSTQASATKATTGGKSDSKDDKAKSKDSSSTGDPLSGVPDDSKGSPLKKITSFSRLYLFMFVLMLIVAGLAVFLTTGLSKKKGGTSTPKATSLTSSQLSQIQGNTTLVGDPKQTLDIQGNAIFEGQGLFRGDLAVAQALKVGGAISGQTLNIGGVGNFNQLQVNQTLSINGDTSASGELSVQKNLVVKGNGSFNGILTASQLTISTLVLNGDLNISQHIVTNGSIPGLSPGAALGSGGTASVSGSDTAGTITINVGSSPAAGTIATLSFSKKFAKTPHVVVTPSGSAGASLQYYVSRSTGSFTLSSLNAPGAGASFSFDYVVVD